MVISYCRERASFYYVAEVFCDLLALLLFETGISISVSQEFLQMVTLQDDDDDDGNNKHHRSNNDANAERK